MIAPRINGMRLVSFISVSSRNSVRSLQSRCNPLQLCIGEMAKSSQPKFPLRIFRAALFAAPRGSTRLKRADQTETKESWNLFLASS